MRDAVRLEVRGVPAVMLVNDVFEPIAHATAALLELPPDYVARNVVWLPHPTSNLPRERAAALIDERIGAIRSALLGRTPSAGASPAAARERDPLALARDTIAAFAQSLREDGADLALVAFDDGVLRGELRLGELTCADGSCIMPAAQLEKLVEAMVRPHLASLRAVALREISLDGPAKGSDVPAS